MTSTVGPVKVALSHLNLNPPSLNSGACSLAKERESRSLR